MPNGTETPRERSVGEIDFTRLVRERGSYHPSPVSWEDQLLYFLMLDRFSDDREREYTGNDGAAVTAGTTPPYDPAVPKAERAAWFAAGAGWRGGMLKGLGKKLGYLRRMGVTALWISPVFKQVQMTYSDFEERPAETNSYHGYGIQNFLDVDSHFGTREELRELVDEAHRLGMYVILDIIFNHAGDVFQYRPDRYSRSVQGEELWTRSGKVRYDPRWDDGTYVAAGFRDVSGLAAAPGSELWPHGGVWPVELQSMRAFNRKGRIENWSYEKEYLEGDFCSLKNIDHGEHARDAAGNKIIDQFFPTPYLKALCDAYRFWIAFADLDGFRIDTVKHMEIGATRLFVREMREFAKSLGKENFFLLGEIAGGRTNAFTTMELTGLDAALGIDDVSDKLEYLPKGWRNAEEYFGLFRNSVEMNKGSHTWYGGHVVTMFDDHDKIGRIKRRYCGDTANHGLELLVPALALNLASAGIPCVYYGTEQYFDGTDETEDRALRESMFGGEFGGRQTQNMHFFDEQSPAYLMIRRLADFRKEHLAVRRGRQYLRSISATGNEGEFGYPVKLGNARMTSVVAWSRIFSQEEIVLAINTDHENPRGAWVTIDAELNAGRGELTCLFSTNPSREGTRAQVEARNGRAVWLEVPAAGFVAYG